MTGLPLTVVSALKFTVVPAAFETVNAGWNPFLPVTTIPPVPADSPSGLNTATPVEYAPGAGNVYVIVGVVCSTVSASRTALNCQLNCATPPGAFDFEASNAMSVPLPAVTVSLASGNFFGSVVRCTQLWVKLLHSVWYQYGCPLITWLNGEPFGAVPSGVPMSATHTSPTSNPWKSPAPMVQASLGIGSVTDSMCSWLRPPLISPSEISPFG